MIGLLVDKPFDTGPDFRHFLVRGRGKKRELKVENLCAEHLYHLIASYVEDAGTKTDREPNSRKKAAPASSDPDLSPFGITLEPVPEFVGWFRGPLCHWEKAEEFAIRLNIRLAPKEYRLLAGYLKGDLDYRIYVAPLIRVRELVEIFRVGENSRFSHGADPEKMVARVAKRLAAVEKICPLAVSFADTGGFFADFVNRLTKEQAAKIDKIFATDDPARDGLECYVQAWSGKGGLMAATLLEDQAIQLWWDGRAPEK